MARTEQVRACPALLTAPIWAADAPSTIAVGAEAPEGAYYGRKTLQQLIRGRSARNTLKMPLLTVKDWPDMESREFWRTGRRGAAAGHR